MFLYYRTANDLEISGNHKIDQLKFGGKFSSDFLWKFLENQNYKNNQNFNPHEPTTLLQATEPRLPSMDPCEQYAHQPNASWLKLPGPGSSVNKRVYAHKSLYNQLLLWGRISPESVKLNSTREDSITKDYDENFAPQRI
ncbi:hypothetical protein EQH57_0320 [Dictyocoela roeselum]|nr:hypothetical protein EQH57_0320 [Dictyocoela roeselum]